MRLGDGKFERNAEIARRVKNGEMRKDLAAEFGISANCVALIVRKWSHKQTWTPETQYAEIRYEEWERGEIRP